MKLAECRGGLPVVWLCGRPRGSSRGCFRLATRRTGCAECLAERVDSNPRYRERTYGRNCAHSWRTIWTQEEASVPERICSPWIRPFFDDREVGRSFLVRVIAYVSRNNSAVDSSLRPAACSRNRRRERDRKLAKTPEAQSGTIPVREW